MKLVQLLYDLALNDDSILYDGFFIRDSLALDDTLMKYFLEETIGNVNFKVVQEGQLREYTLFVLFKIW